MKNKNGKKIPYYDRSFGDKKMRGKVVDGDWDVPKQKFIELDIYKALERRINEKAKWQDTKFYTKVCKQVESGRSIYGIKNINELNKRCEHLDSLYESIKKGYRCNRNIQSKNAEYDEVEINIGRNGEYLFQNGVHRLGIAKILGIKSVPVMVFVRHKKWQEFREFVISYAQRMGTCIGNKLYQPIVHPDLDDIPYLHGCQNRLNSIIPQLGEKKGTMLDIGANLGFFCHKFSDLGYQCYAIEQDSDTFYILEKIRIAEKQKFKAINKSIFDVELIKTMKFDVVLALNIFHHFLKRKKHFFNLKIFLKKLKTYELIFEPHQHHEKQMNGAYVNFTETEFIDFLLRHTSLNESKLIHTAKYGRHIFKLYKK